MLLRLGPHQDPKVCDLVEEPVDTCTLPNLPRLPGPSLPGDLGGMLALPAAIGSETPRSLEQTSAGDATAAYPGHPAGDERAVGSDMSRSGMSKDEARNRMRR